MSKFAVVDNNKVVMVADGQPFGDGRNCVLVPDDCPIIQGQDIREYAEDWSLRPLADRVADGLVKLESRLEVVGETLRAKSYVKLILEGIEEIPAGYKLVMEANAPDGFPAVDGYALVPLTPYELMAKGLIDKPKGQKIVEDVSVFGGYRLEPMTPDERVIAGEITALDVSKIELKAEEVRLQGYLDETDRFASRAVDYLVSSGATGKEMPIGMLSERQTARDRISAIRILINDMEAKP